MTLIERLELAQLDHDIEEACRRAIHRAMREMLAEPPIHDWDGDEAMRRVFLEIEALRPDEQGGS